MNRLRSPPAALPVLLTATLAILSLGSTPAQEPPADLLNDYRLATGALTQSVEVFADDQVESLDALRRAKAASLPLTTELEPPLRRGLTKTFGSAEAAIVNQSETDLRVQAAVLRGGFQRVLYRAALEGAAADLPRAQELLGVVATDLGMTETTFSGASQRALQTTFEERLAALSLSQLDRLSDDREGRYEVLADVYGHIFLVQDSPRLPAQAQTTLLNAVQALVTDQPLAPPLATLRAQLTEFENAARAQAPDRAVRPDTAPRSETPIAEPATTETPATDTTPSTAAPEAVEQAAGSSPTEGAVEGVTEDETVGSVGEGNKGEGAAQETTDALAEIDIAPELTPDAEAAATTADTATGVGAATAPAARTPSATRPPPPTAAPLGPNKQIRDLRDPLLLVAGALALIALSGLLFAHRSPVPWRDTAVALLLLPVVSEGVIALAPTLAPPLEPYLTLPTGNLGAYSLFTSPLVQVLWLSLVILASLCLLLSLRPSRVDKVVRTETAPAATAAEETSATTATGTAPVTNTSPNTSSNRGDAPVRTSSQTGKNLTTGSGFNWDEDF